MLTQVLEEDSIRFWDKLYRKIWYVNVIRKLPNAKFTAKYIGRYTKRPVLAETRIKNYDGQTVTFEYEDKAAKIHKITTLPVEEFISRLIRHIPDRNFRQIRYYGAYANRTRTNDLAKAQAILKLTKGKRLEPVYWRDRCKWHTGYDPLICCHCGSELKLVKLVYRSRDGPLKEISFE